MTGPYQPPGGDINSPFGPPDPNSPFTPAPGSGNSDPKGEGPSDEEESSSAGVQYELETPGQPPLTPPPPSHQQPGYGPPAPPPPTYAPQPNYVPPPKKSGSNNGMIIGGVIAGVVVLLILVGIVIVAVAMSSSGGGKGSEEAFKSTYTIPGDPCADVDMSAVEAIGSFETAPTGSSNPSESYGYGSCYGGFGTYGESNYGYYSLNVNTYSTDSGMDSGWSSATGSTYMSGCETSDVSGSWDQGKLGTGTSCGSPINGNKVVLSIQADNLVATLTLDGDSDIASKGPDALKSVAESLLTASKA